MSAKPKKFEEELKDLEAIVNQIDSGELSLEDSIDAFERGVALVKSLNKRLDEVEKRVEVLTRSAGGTMQSTELDAESASRSKESKDSEDEEPF